MDYYTRRMKATKRIVSLRNEGKEVIDIILTISAEFGLSKKFVLETLDTIEIVSIQRMKVIRENAQTYLSDLKEKTL